MIFESTAYCYTGHKTKSGTWPKEGRTVSVDPNIIPLGSKLVINGVSGYIAEDTGKKIIGKRLDIYMISRGDCLRFGRRNMEVRVIEPILSR